MFMGCCKGEELTLHSGEHSPVPTFLRRVAVIKFKVWEDNWVTPRPKCFAGGENEKDDEHWIQDLITVVRDTEKS